MDSLKNRYYNKYIKYKIKYLTLKKDYNNLHIQKSGNLNKIKFIRLGFTESSLLFVYWLNYFKKISNEHINDLKNGYTRYMYTTCGYYDKTQKGDIFTIVHKVDPPQYKKYYDMILNNIKDCDILEIHLTDQIEKKLKDVIPYKDLWDEFIKNHNAKKLKRIGLNDVYDIIRDNKILIISPFSPLIKKQIDSGNCKKIYPDMPNITLINIYKFPYTYFNNGPHNNSFETTEFIYQDIIKNIKDCDYNTVLIGCGSYSAILSTKFNNKNVCLLGNEMQIFFGIMNKRTSEIREKNNIKTENLEYWITKIPDEYKPEGYEKIEGGCYW